MPQSPWVVGSAPTDAWTPGPAPAPNKAETEPKPLNTRERVVSGALNALLGMGKTAAKASGVPGLFREGVVGAIKDQAEVAKQLFYDAPAEMFERARNAETPAEQQAYGAAGLIPVVGPMAGHIGTEIAEGRAPEAAGEVIAGSILPFVPKAARATVRGGEAAAAGVGSMVPTGGARAALLAKAAKYAAKQVIPPIVVEGADLAINAIRKNAAASETPTVVAPRPVVDDPPPPSYAIKNTTSSDTSVSPENLGRATETVGGLKVRKDIPNTSSIRSSFDNYEELPGVREVPMSVLDDKPPKFYSKSEEARTRKLAEDIKASGEINPLIVAFDEKGPYILEGGHRFDALKLLDVKSFPAIVVKDLDVQPAIKATPSPKTSAVEKLQGPKSQATKEVAPKKSAAEQLMEKANAKELARVKKALGTDDVKISRYEPRTDSTGKPIGVSDPVYVVPDEFLEQAQTMGLRARAHTALEKSYRSR